MFFLFLCCDPGMSPPQRWALCHPKASARWGSSEPAPPSLSGPSPRWRAWPSWPRPSSRTRVTAVPSTRGAADRGETNESKKLMQKQNNSEDIDIFSPPVSLHTLLFSFLKGKRPEEFYEAVQPEPNYNVSHFVIEFKSFFHGEIGKLFFASLICSFFSSVPSFTALFLSFTLTSKQIIVKSVDSVHILVCFLYRLTLYSFTEFINLLFGFRQGLLADSFNLSNATARVTLLLGTNL